MTLCVKITFEDVAERVRIFFLLSLMFADCVSGKLANDVSTCLAFVHHCHIAIDRPVLFDQTLQRVLQSVVKHLPLMVL